MSKPLELKVFPKVPRLDDSGELGYACGRWVIADWSSVFGAKKLSDAELAAEYWFMEAVTADQSSQAARGHVRPIDVLMAQDDLATMRRFATLPHAEYKDYE